MTKSKGKSKPTSASLEIPEEEQFRLINESGIMSKIATAPRDQLAETTADESERGLSPLIEELCYALFFIIPFSFLLAVMEILIHYQYGRHPTLEALLKRTLSGVPILSVFIFYALRYKTYRQVQAALFILSCISGSRLIWMLNKANWLTNMDQCPPLATAWVFSVVMLDLGPSLFSLILTGGFVWYTNLKLAL